MKTKKNEYIELGALANLQSASIGLFLRLNGLLIALHILITFVQVVIVHNEITGAQLFIPCYILLYIAVYQGISLRLCSHLLMAVMFLEVLFVGMLTGGLSSHLTAFIIIIPLLSALLLGKIVGWMGLVACSLLTLWLFYEAPSVMGNSGSPENKLISSPLILVFFMYLLKEVGIHYYTVLSDMVQKLWAEANIDHMTNLNNRRGIEAALEKELLRAKRNNTWISACVIDIDHFKRYNDINGHNKGDDCLKFVAKQIDMSLRRPPDLSARLGGEEFLIVLPETDAPGAKYVAEKLRQSIEQLKLRYDPQKTDVITVSIGVASLNAESLTNTTANLLIELADQALYEAKAHGRNRVVVANAENLTKSNANPVALETI